MEVICLQQLQFQPVQVQNTLNTGYGVIGGFYYEYASNWRIGLTLGFIRFGANSTEINNYFQTRLPDGTEGNIDIDGSVSTIPILLSCKYVIPSGSSTKFYGIIEGGLYTYWTKTKGKYSLHLA